MPEKSVSKKIEIGSTVRLKDSSKYTRLHSYEKLMKVTDIHGSGNWLATCTWNEADGKNRAVVFPISELEAK